jgi:hypothetical protein
MIFLKINYWKKLACSRCIGLLLKAIKPLIHFAEMLLSPSWWEQPNIAHSRNEALRQASADENSRGDTQNGVRQSHAAFRIPFNLSSLRKRIDADLSAVAHSAPLGAYTQKMSHHRLHRQWTK